EALGTAGAGFIGDYSHCTFQTEGVGTFKPLDGTNPFIGEKGKMAFVEEDKLETIIKEADISSILKTLNEVHPYEEVAYDLRSEERRVGKECRMQRKQKDLK